MLSQFIQRALGPVLGRGVRLHRVRSATRLLMRHIGLHGRCDCMRTHDERGRRGVLLRIETGQRVPLAERPQFQAYFQRKLFELGRTEGQNWLKAHHQDVGVRPSLNIADNV